MKPNSILSSELGFQRITCAWNGLGSLSELRDRSADEWNRGHWPFSPHQLRILTQHFTLILTPALKTKILADLGGSQKNFQYTNLRSQFVTY
jgi:hypothetical protein